MTGGIWFTSDLHFGHQRVAEIRGFDNTMAHDLTVVRNWERVVKPQDAVHVLGDLTCDQRKEDYALEVVESLPGTKHLIAGNHDSVSSIHRNGWKRVSKWLRTFSSVRDFAKIRSHKQDILMSHYPYSNSERADHSSDVRYAPYRLRDCGLPLLHGHTHLADQRLHHTVSNHTPQVHVGLDAWNFTPVSLGTVEKLLFGEETT